MVEVRIASQAASHTCAWKVSDNICPESADKQKISRVLSVGNKVLCPVSWIRESAVRSVQADWLDGGAADVCIEGFSMISLLTEVSSDPMKPCQKINKNKKIGMQFEFNKSYLELVRNVLNCWSANTCSEFQIMPWSTSWSKVMFKHYANCLVRHALLYLCLMGCGSCNRDFIYHCQGNKCNKVGITAEINSFIQIQLMQCTQHSLMFSPFFLTLLVGSGTPWPPTLICTNFPEQTQCHLLPMQILPLSSPSEKFIKTPSWPFPNMSLTNGMSHA